MEARRRARRAELDRLLGVSQPAESATPAATATATAPTRTHLTSTATSTASTASADFDDLLRGKTKKPEGGRTTSRLRGGGGRLVLAEKQLLEVDKDATPLSEIRSSRINKEGCVEEDGVRADETTDQQHNLPRSRRQSRFDALWNASTSDAGCGSTTSGKNDALQSTDSTSKAAARAVEAVAASAPPFDDDEVRKSAPAPPPSRIQPTINLTGNNNVLEEDVDHEDHWQDPINERLSSMIEDDSGFLDEFATSAAEWSIQREPQKHQQNKPSRIMVDTTMTGLHATSTMNMSTTSADEDKRGIVLANAGSTRTDPHYFRGDLLHRAAPTSSYDTRREDPPQLPPPRVLFDSQPELQLGGEDSEDIMTEHLMAQARGSGSRYPAEQAASVPSSSTSTASSSSSCSYDKFHETRFGATTAAGTTSGTASSSSSFCGGGWGPQQEQNQPDNSSAHDQEEEEELEIGAAAVVLAGSSSSESGKTILEDETESGEQPVKTSANDYDDPMQRGAPRRGEGTTGAGSCSSSSSSTFGAPPPPPSGSDRINNRGGQTPETGFNTIEQNARDWVQQPQTGRINMGHDEYNNHPAVLEQQAEEAAGPVSHAAGAPFPFLHDTITSAAEERAAHLERQLREVVGKCEQQQQKIKVLKEGFAEKQNEVKLLEEQREALFAESETSQRANHRLEEELISAKKQLKQRSKELQQVVGRSQGPHFVGGGGGVSGARAGVDNSKACSNNQKNATRSTSQKAEKSSSGGLMANFAVLDSLSIFGGSSGSSSSGRSNYAKGGRGGSSSGVLDDDVDSNLTAAEKEIRVMREELDRQIGENQQVQSQLFDVTRLKAEQIANLEDDITLKNEKLHELQNEVTGLQTEREEQRVNGLNLERKILEAQTAVAQKEQRLQRFTAAAELERERFRKRLRRHFPVVEPTCGGRGSMTPSTKMTSAEDTSSSSSAEVSVSTVARVTCLWAKHLRRLLEFFEQTTLEMLGASRMPGREKSRLVQRIARNKNALFTAVELLAECLVAGAAEGSRQHFCRSTRPACWGPGTTRSTSSSIPITTSSWSSNSSSTQMTQHLSTDAFFAAATLCTPEQEAVLQIWNAEPKPSPRAPSDLNVHRAQYFSIASPTKESQKTAGRVQNFMAVRPPKILNFTKSPGGDHGGTGGKIRAGQEQVEQHEGQRAGGGGPPAAINNIRNWISQRASALSPAKLLHQNQSHPMSEDRGGRGDGTPSNFNDRGSCDPHDQQRAGSSPAAAKALSKSRSKTSTVSSYASEDEGGDLVLDEAATHSCASTGEGGAAKPRVEVAASLLGGLGVLVPRAASAAVSNLLVPPLNLEDQRETRTTAYPDNSVNTNTSFLYYLEPPSSSEFNADALSAAFDVGAAGGGVASNAAEMSASLLRAPAPKPLCLLLPDEQRRRLWHQTYQKCAKEFTDRLRSFVQGLSVADAVVKRHYDSTNHGGAGGGPRTSSYDHPQYNQKADGAAASRINRGIPPAQHQLGPFPGTRGPQRGLENVGSYVTSRDFFAEPASEKTTLVPEILWEFYFALRKLLRSLQMFAIASLAKERHHSKQHFSRLRERAEAARSAATVAGGLPDDHLAPLDFLPAGSSRTAPAGGYHQHVNVSPVLREQGPPQQLHQVEVAATSTSTHSSKQTVKSHASVSTTSSVSSRRTSERISTATHENVAVLIRAAALRCQTLLDVLSSSIRQHQIQRAEQAVMDEDKGSVLRSVHFFASRLERIACASSPAGWNAGTGANAGAAGTEVDFLRQCFLKQEDEETSSYCRPLDLEDLEREGEMNMHNSSLQHDEGPSDHDRESDSFHVQVSEDLLQGRHLRAEVLAADYRQELKRLGVERFFPRLLSPTAGGGVEDITNSISTYGELREKQTALQSRQRSLEIELETLKQTVASQEAEVARLKDELSESRNVMDPRGREPSSLRLVAAGRDPAWSSSSGAPSPQTTLPLHTATSRSTLALKNNPGPLAEDDAGFHSEDERDLVWKSHKDKRLQDKPVHKHVAVRKLEDQLTNRDMLVDQLEGAIAWADKRTEDLQKVAQKYHAQIQDLSDERETMRDIIERKVAECEELKSSVVETKRSYEDQISVLSEHLCALDLKLSQARSGSGR